VATVEAKDQKSLRMTSDTSVSLRRRRIDLLSASLLNWVLAAALLSAGYLLGRAVGGGIAGVLGGVSLLVVLIWRNVTASVSIREATVSVRNRFRTVVLPYGDIQHLVVRHLDGIPNSPPILALELQSANRLVKMDATMAWRAKDRAQIVAVFDSLVSGSKGLRHYLEWR
jgi:hypothetical protein